MAEDGVEQGRFADPAWQRTVASASESVTIIDHEFRVVFSNRCEAERVGGPVFARVDPRFHDHLRGAVAQALSTGHPQHFESEIAGSDGASAVHSNWVATLAIPGTESLVSITATDITHVRAISAELEDSRETLRSLVDNAPDHIMMVDPRHRVLFANRLAMGFAPDQAVGTPIEEFVPSDQRGTVRAAIDEVLASGTHAGFEVRVDARDGPRWFSTRLGPILRNDEVVRVALISTEITERVLADQEHARLSAELQQAQKMEALGQLTGGIAHDFNNLLTVVAGNLELLAQSLEDPIQARGYVEAALQGVLRAGSLTQRLLTFSRKHPLEPRRVDVNELVRGMTDLLARSLGTTVRVEAALDDRLWQCRVDPAQLENALLNLAINARDAMPRGGVVSIDTRNERIEVPRVFPGGTLLPGDYLRIDVADNGAGINEVDLGRVFEPFFTTKETGKGSGLGLSMVFGFANQSGGQVGIESRPEHGTRVMIYLPRDRSAPAVEVAEDGGVAATGSGELLLVVEDESAVRLMTVRLLRVLGYRTLEAADGLEALEVLDQNPDVDLLLSDVVLPGGLNGVQVAERARQVSPDLQVLLMSGYVDSVFAECDQLDPTLEFLPKPFTREELAARVRRTLRARP